MDCKIKQKDELAVMMSIFSDEFEVGENSNEMNGTQYIHVQLPDNFQIKWLNDKGEKKGLILQFLPPIRLMFTFPEDYPTKSPPSFSLECGWLRNSEIENLDAHLHKMWREEKDVILYKWVAFLKYDLLNFLDIVDFLDINALYAQSNTRELLTGAVSLNVSGEISQEACNTKGIECKSNEEDMTTPSHNVFCEETNMETAMETAMETDMETDTETDTEKDTEKDLRIKQASLIQKLKDYNTEKQREAFNKEVFSCNICFASNSGNKSMQFQPCQHVFCKQCVKTYFEVVIKDGCVQDLACPEVNCKSVVHQSQVRELVSAELFALYDDSLFNFALTTMSDITNCPIPSCEKPIIFNPNDSVVSCSSCQYVFCITCKRGNHGVEPCAINTNDKRKLVAEYCSASPEEKLALEKKYGKQPLRTLVNNILSQDWIEEHTKACPGCNANIEKKDGCNKMLCRRCSTQFCWLCRKMMSTDPYLHFFSTQSSCKGLLFDEPKQNLFQ